MNDRPQTDAAAGTAEFEQLAAALCDGQIDTAGIARLEQLATADPALMAQLVHLLNLDAHLRQRTRGTAVAAEIVGETVEPSANSDQLSAQEETVQSSLPHASLLTTQSSFQTFIRQNNFAVAVAVAFMAITAVVGWMASSYLPGVATSENKPAAESKNGVVAWLLGTRGAEWLDDTQPVGTRLVLGQRLAIQKGMVEIRFATGANVVLEGPAEFFVGTKDQGKEKNKGERKKDKQTTGSSSPHPSSIHPSNAGYLALGSLVARCDGESAKHFAVTTPATIVEDLGTEFAIKVSDTGRTLVHVVSGRVAVGDLTSSDTPVLELVGGQTAVAGVDEGHVLISLDRSFKNQIATMRRSAGRLVIRAEAFHLPPAKLPWQPVAGDLVDGLIAESSLAAINSLSGLTDGRSTPRYPQKPDGRVLTDGDEPWELTFDLAKSQGGEQGAGRLYDINEIRVFSYNTDARVFQDYDVEISTDGAAWEAIAKNIRNGRRGKEINLSAGVQPDYYHDYSLTRLSRRDGTPLTDPLRFIRFRFYAPAAKGAIDTFSRRAGFHHTSLYEIDILGAPSDSAANDKSQTPDSARDTETEDHDSRPPHEVRE